MYGCLWRSEVSATDKSGCAVRASAKSPFLQMMQRFRFVMIYERLLQIISLFLCYFNYFVVILQPHYMVRERSYQSASTCSSDFTS